MRPDVQKLVRQWITSELEKRKKDRAWLAAQAGISEPSLSLFFSDKDDGSGGKRGLGHRNMAKIEATLGLCPVEGASALKAPSIGQVGGNTLQMKDAPLWIPVIDIRRAPVGVDPDQLHARITAMSEPLFPSPISDPKAFWLRLSSAAGQYPAGTQVLVSPSTPVLPGESAVWETKSAWVVGVAASIRDNGEIHLAHLGQIDLGARLIGRVMGAYTPI